MATGIPTTFNFGAKVTPQQAAANYVSGASGKGTKWATNYLTSKVNPFQAAAAASATWLNAINQAGEKAFVAGLSSVNTANVAKLVATQGPALYAAGVQNKGVAKYTVAAQGLIPALQQIAANLPPRGTLQQNIARSAAMQMAAANLKGQYKGY